MDFNDILTIHRWLYFDDLADYHLNSGTFKQLNTKTYKHTQSKNNNLEWDLGKKKKKQDKKWGSPTG